jgi:acetyltransferase-like isoleucine patch superfamily enzyme
MRYAGLGYFGRIATRFAAWTAPPHKARLYLASMNPKGYISADAVIHHSNFRFGSNVFIDDRAVIFERRRGEPLVMGDRVAVYRDVILETGYSGALFIGSDTSIHPRCQVNAYVSTVHIGNGVMIAPCCALYSYDHSFFPDQPIRKQKLRSKGPVVIEDEAWLGYGATVLSGVRIGYGAVIGAGSVVTEDVPDGAIAVGSPARVVKMRSELSREFTDSLMFQRNAGYRR